MYASGIVRVDNASGFVLGLCYCQRTHCPTLCSSLSLPLLLMGHESYLSCLSVHCLPRKLVKLVRFCQLLFCCNRVRILNNIFNFSNYGNEKRRWEINANLILNYCSERNDYISGKAY